MTADEKKKGIAWAGSLVGSQNPDAPTGYRYSTKRYKIDEDVEHSLPENIQIKFQNRQGEQLSEILDLPISSSIDDLTALVQQLLQNDDKIPYSFFTLVDGKETEVFTTLQELLTSNPSISTETTLQLTYQPLAIFRVRPVTRCTDTLQGHTEAVLHVSFAPNGKFLSSCGGDTVVRFWDVYTATTKFTCLGHKDHVLTQAWSPDALRFASADKRGVLILWDPNSGKSMKTIQAHKQWITDLAWEPLHLVSNSTFTCERLATSSKDGTVKLWNTRTGSSIRTLSGHIDSVESIQWSGEGFLYSASRDRTIKMWNVDRGILIRTLQGHGHRVNTLALSSEGVLRAGPFDYKTTSFDNAQEAVKVAKEKYDQHRKQHGPDKLVSGSDDFTLFIWDPETSKHPVKRLTGHQQPVNDIAYSPDGRYFASASFDKKVKIWNGHTGDFIATLTGHVGAVYQVAWSADSRYLVSASKDSTAKLWEMPKCARARETLPGHADEVYALDWSPISGNVATGSKDRTIKIWKH